MGGNKSYLPFLGHDQKDFITINGFFKQRGWNNFPDVVLYTRFPFGFFKKWIRLEFDKEKILAYPKISKIKLESLSNPNEFGESQREKAGDGDEIRTIRFFNEGDNTKLIHWKLSAKRSKLIMKELQEDESRESFIEFNPLKYKENLESYISRVASTLIELTKNGFEVRFICPDRSFSTQDFGSNIRPILKYLALYRLQT